MTPDAWQAFDPKHRSVSRGRLRSGMYFTTTVHRYFPFGGAVKARVVERTATGLTQEAADEEVMRVTEPALRRLAKARMTA